MSETQAENPKPKELITPDAIKGRVMAFFQDVDLSQDGTSKTSYGVITVKSGKYPRSEERWHEASVNGFKAARYEHLIPDSKLEPLSVGQDRQVAIYELHGNNSNGNVSVTLREFEIKPAELTIAIPGNAMNSNGKRGPIQKFDDFDKKFVAELLGI